MQYRHTLMSCRRGTSLPASAVSTTASAPSFRSASALALPRHTATTRAPITLAICGAAAGHHGAWPAGAPHTDIVDTSHSHSTPPGDPAAHGHHPRAHHLNEDRTPTFTYAVSDPIRRVEKMFSQATPMVPTPRHGQRAATRCSAQMLFDTVDPSFICPLHALNRDVLRSCRQHGPHSTCTAAMPTPPAAPSTSTVWPGCRLARSCRATCDVPNATGSPAAPLDIQQGFL